MENLSVKNLRIGNYIGWESTGEIEMVKDIETSGIRSPKINAVDISDYRPIPLTEKWLKDFGFRRTSFGMTLNEFYLEAGSTIIKTGELQSFSLEIVPDKKYIKINSVHHLQNIYLDFTENELEIVKHIKL